MKKFYLETYGCKMNQADSGLIRVLLNKEFKETFDFKKADFIIINSCGVVETTERKIFKRIKEIKRFNKKIILAGCLTLISLKKARNLINGAIGPQNILSILEIAKFVLQGKKKFIIEEQKFDKAGLIILNRPSIRRKGGEVSAIVQISEGCLGNCSYCVTKFARGKLYSFEMESILKNIELLVKNGYKEIQLTSQDSAVYGFDKGKFLLPELLKKIAKIKGNFRVRVGMMNPAFVKLFLNDLISAFQSQKIYKFFHLPLQSGDNKILKLMKRNHTAEEFLEIINKIKKNFKDVLIATDIIVGFPGESENSFKKTLKVIKKTKPAVCHIFQYSKRNLSEASKLKDFPGRIKKARSGTLTKIWKEINLKENKKFLGKKEKVLISQKGKNFTFICRTPSFRAVIIKTGKLGVFKTAKITGFKENYLVGKIL